MNLDLSACVTFCVISWPLRIHDFYWLTGVDSFVGKRVYQNSNTQVFVESFKLIEYYKKKNVRQLLSENHIYFQLFVMFA